MAMPHSIDDEAVATEAVDVGSLLVENASLRDRLLRALAEAENTRRRADRTAEDAALIEGVRATLRVLMQTLERFGVRRIDALGQRFDPSLHEVMMDVDDP